MPGDDLRSISDLQDNHRRVLASKLGITSLQALADADQRAIHTALGTVRPRPSLRRIAAWQGEARSRLTEAAIDISGWHTAASFAVIFAQRQVDGIWERRLEAGQTEVESAVEPWQSPGWDCGAMCDWMLGKVSPLQEAAGTHAAPAGEVTAATAGEPPADAVATPVGRARLRIVSATITDARRDVAVISAGNLLVEPPEDLRLPVRLRLTVAGGRSGQQLRAAVWFRRRAAPGWSPQEPVNLPPSGQAEFDLSPVPPGRHDIRLLAWGTDPEVVMAAVSLPRLTFLQQPHHHGEPSEGTPPLAEKANSGARP